MSKEIDLEIIRTEEDVLHMLDSILEKRDNEWWDKFYSDKTKPIPFFKNIPDENLVSYVNSGYFKPGKILDIGCGNGRNSIYLTKQGFTVDGMDFSETSINWANEWAKETDVNVNFICTSIFDYEIPQGRYDYIYDSGCLHHIKPHRRNKYLEIIYNSLKSGGLLGLTCFNLKGGANISDYDVYRDYSMHGGIGFSEYKLRKILEPYFSIIEFREMLESKDETMFGKEFCWTVLAKKI